ncbi:MAG: methionyl-tRNA formyltransferase [Odoribacter sp.]|nr:methionyl-tRNA formyltransferase [Odoribacter sp.]
MQRQDLRIVYMGTPDFAVLPLKRLVEAGFRVVGVVTNPDKPAGRGQQLQESAVKQYARQAGLPVLQPEKFRDERFLQELAAWKADIQLVVAFKMLPEVVWSMPRLGTVNLHASLLPDYRGAAPINWAVMNGERVSGVSTFLLKHEIDTGNIIFQEKVNIGEEMTAGELHDELMARGAELLQKTVEAIASGDYPLVDQSVLLQGREAIHAPKIFKEDMKIDWRASLDTIYNHVRGLSPFPAAWAELRHRESGQCVTFKVFKTLKIAEVHTHPAGEISTDGRTVFDVYVAGGRLRILELQLSGKKRMPVEDFLRGFRLEDYILNE